jgi:membrane protease YdiL (CAAX protease family)
MWADIARVIFLVAALDVLASFLLQATVVPADLPADVPGDALRRALFAPFMATRMIVVIVAIATILLHRGQSLRTIGLTSSRWGMNLLIGIAATATAYGLALVWQVVIWFVWPELWEQMGENAERIMNLIPKPDHPISFVPITLAVGIYEELLFRGFLLPRLRRATGGWTIAVLISSAVFTALHASDQVPAALVPVAILSVVFSLVTIWRRSLVPAIVGHFVFDLCSLVGLYYLAGDQWT